MLETTNETEVPQSPHSNINSTIVNKIHINTVGACSNATIRNEDNDRSYIALMKNNPTRARSWWYAISIGQIVSILMAGTNICANALQYPNHTAFVLWTYILLVVIYAPVYFILISRKRPRVAVSLFTSIGSSFSSSTGNISNRNDNKIVINGGESIPLVNGRHASNIRKRCDDPAWHSLDVENSIIKSNTIDQLKNRTISNRWDKWKSLILRLAFAVCDVEANFLAVNAYMFTNQVSVSLILSCNVPFVMLLSRFFFGMTYSLTHYAGSAVCLLGLGLTIAANFIADASSARGGAEPVKGDFMALGASVLYVLSNIFQESILKGSAMSMIDQQINQFQKDTVTDEDKREDFLATKDSGDMAVILTNVNNNTSQVERNEENRTSTGLPWQEIVRTNVLLGCWGSAICIVQIIIMDYGKTSTFFRDIATTFRENPHYKSEWYYSDFNQQQSSASLYPPRDVMYPYAYFVGFNISMIGVYTIASLLISECSAVIFNLSILSSDAYILFYSRVVMKKPGTYLFYLSFFVTIIGAILFQVAEFATDALRERRKNGDKK